MFVEVYARIGVLKQGHRHKVATDVLKLGTLSRSHSGSFVLAFCDDTAAAAVKNKS